jgi:hypothetical protein
MRSGDRYGEELNSGERAGRSRPNSGMLPVITHGGNTLSELIYNFFAATILVATFSSAGRYISAGLYLHARR